MITSTLGLFYKTNGKPFDFVNQYGDTVRIYGNGIYKNDSYFMAPIFKGTDFTVFFLAVPLLLIALIMNIKKNSLQTTLFLTAVIAFFMYYSASISLGVVYNVLHLVYIALFSCSFFAFITGFSLLREYDITASETMYTRSLKIFLILCGVSLFVAWLPDIIVSLQNNRSLALIEVYTTQITYVFDMAIISPVIFVCLYHVSKRNSLGYMLLGIILNTLVLVGILVINQTLFQAIAGIELPIGAIITKVGIFVLLALVAIYYEVRLFRKIKGSDYSIVKKFIDT
jgi:hypothetical protein